jgi:hypothetical protein
MRLPISCHGSSSYRFTDATRNPESLKPLPAVLVFSFCRITKPKSGISPNSDRTKICQLLLLRQSLKKMKVCRIIYLFITGCFNCYFFDFIIFLRASAALIDRLKESLAHALLLFTYQVINSASSVTKYKINVKEVKTRTAQH